MRRVFHKIDSEAAAMFLARVSERWVSYSVEMGQVDRLVRLKAEFLLAEGDFAALEGVMSTAPTNEDVADDEWSKQRR